jgi:C4-dicarboxylate-specific signal transduction histidine kinase
VEEIRLLMLVLPAALAIVVQILALVVASAVMAADLKTRSVATADELRQLLEDPLYKVDDAQAIRIGEALLSSGRIAGIELHSEASGTLLSMSRLTAPSSIPIQERIVERGGMRLGRVRLSFSDAEITFARRLFGLLSVIVVVTVLAASWLVSLTVVRRRIQVPLGAIVEGIGAIADGDYNRPVLSTAYADVNELVGLVNDMASKVLSKSRELVEANALLEERVAARTEELQTSLAELRLAQNRLVESEKLRALGQLSASLAHELNTPLAAILSAVRSIVDYFDRCLPETEAFVSTLDEGRRAFFNRLLCLGMEACQRFDGAADMKPDRERIGRISERLRAIAGKADPTLVDGIVELGIVDIDHELLPWIGDQEAPAILAFAAGPVGARKMAAVASIAAHKAAGVVAALRTYLAPQSSIGQGRVDVVRDIETVLVLLRGLIKNGICVSTDLKPAVVRGSAEKLDLVWMNLIRNAIQAMGYWGDLGIATKAEGGRVEVSISDSGPGIPENIHDRIFEPFFTTKRDGEGMGLGLGIAKSIVEAHGGAITFRSRPGRTVFTVDLPAYTEEPAAPKG